MKTAGSSLNQSINTIVIAGEVSGRITFSTTSAGAPVCNFNLTTFDLWHDNQGKERRRIDEHRVAVFGGAAETINATKQEGDYLVVRGRLRYGPDGRAEIVAANVGGPEII